MINGWRFFFSFSSNINYFDSNNIKSSRYLTYSNKFYDIYLAYRNEGLFLYVDIKKKVEIINNDFIELFFDTRNLKSLYYLDKYCHHFVFFFEKEEDHFVKEVTKFRGDNLHLHADPTDIFVKVKKTRNNYSYDMCIPQKCLYGFDPEKFTNIGFAFRINSFEKTKKIGIPFADVEVERQRNLWHTLKMNWG